MEEYHRDPRLHCAYAVSWGSEEPPWVVHPGVPAPGAEPRHHRDRWMKAKLSITCDALRVYLAHPEFTLSSTARVYPGRRAHGMAVLPAKALRLRSGSPPRTMAVSSSALSISTSAQRSWQPTGYVRPTSGGEVRAFQARCDSPMRRDGDQLNSGARDLAVSPQRLPFSRETSGQSCLGGMQRARMRHQPQ